MSEYHDPGPPTTAAPDTVHGVDDGQSEQFSESDAAAERKQSQKPPVPAIWWMLAACFVATVAIAGQSVSLLGLIRANEHLSKLDTYNDLKLRLTTQTNQLRESKAKLDGAIESLRVQRDRMAKEIAANEGALSDQKERNTRGEKRVQELLDQYHQLQGDIAQAEAQVAQAESRVAQAEEQLGKLESDYAALLAENVPSLPGRRRGS